MIRQGDVHWIDLGRPRGSGPGYRHPHVVVQNNVFNQSRIHTVVVCVVISNLKRADAPGNVLVPRGEANLPEASVVNVSQVFTVDRSQIGDRIGTLPVDRIEQVIAGLRLVIEPREPE